MATLTLDARQSNYFPIIVTAAITEISIENGVDGQVLSLVFQQDKTGHSVSAGAGNIQGFVAPSASANAITAQQFIYSAIDNTWLALQSTATATAPAGGNGAIQFNNSGAFGGDDTAFTFDDADVQFLLTGRQGPNEQVMLVVGPNAGLDLVLNGAASPPTASFDNSEPGGTLFVTSDGALTIDSASGSVLLRATGAKMIEVANGAKIGFYSGTPQTKATITGSKGANAALASLLTALAAFGLVTDSST